MPGRRKQGDETERTRQREKEEQRTREMERDRERERWRRVDTQSETGAYSDTHREKM